MTRELKFITFWMFLLLAVKGALTRIPDGIIIMDVRPNLLEGRDGKLQCKFYGLPYAVYWFKGPDIESANEVVTWYKAQLSGPGYDSGNFNMTEDYSLIIYDVNDDDEGRYICRVSDHRGILILNQTDVSVKTPPSEPYPIIDQCLDSHDQASKGGACSLDAPGTVTCRVENSSRNLVTLSWIHEGIEFDSVTTRTSMANDIIETVVATISAPRSNNPYSCVAEVDAVGVLSRTAEITIPQLMTSTTVSAETTSVITVNTTVEPKPNRTRNMVAVASSISAVIVVILLLVLLLVKYRAQAKSKSHDSGPVSYIELWKLSNLSDKQNFLHELQLLVEGPCTAQNSELISIPILFGKLCKWKDGLVGQQSAQMLYDHLEKGGLTNNLKEIKDYRHDLTDKVSDGDLECICFSVSKSVETLRSLLHILRINLEYKKIELPQDWRRGLEVLKKWRGEAPTVKSSDEVAVNMDKDEHVSFIEKSEVNFRDNLNQHVRLCLALEKIGCRDIARTFFQIDDEYKKEITEDDFRKFGVAVSQRHSSKLGAEAKLSDDEVYERNFENLSAVFATDKLIMEWWSKQHCSSYETRCRLRNIALKCDRRDIADTFIPSTQYHDDNQLSMRRDENEIVPSSLTNTEESECSGAVNGNQGEPTNQTADYAEEITDEEFSRVGHYTNRALNLSSKKEKHSGLISFEFPWQTARTRMREELKKMNSKYLALIPEPKGEDVYEIELVDLAFRLFVTDVYPFAESLGYECSDMERFRVKFNAENIKKGTHALVLNIFKQSRKRTEMCKVLKSREFKDITRVFMFGSSVGFGHLLAVSQAVDGSRLAEGLCIKEEDWRRTDSESVDTMALLRLWKDGIHPPAYNHRTALADVVHDMGHNDLAFDILSGKHRDAKAAFLAILNEIASQVSPHNISTLCRVLDVKEKSKGSHTVDEVLQSWAEDKLFSWTLQKTDPRTLSDDLFRKGFYSFAYEVMAGLTRKNFKNSQEESSGKDATDVQKADEHNNNAEVPKPDECQSHVENAIISQDTSLATTGDAEGQAVHTSETQ